MAIEMIELCLGAVNMGGQQGRERMQENTGMKISREIGFGWVERKGKDICWDGIFFFLIQPLLTGGNGHKEHKNRLRNHLALVQIPAQQHIDKMIFKKII